nr:immunoglobulin heavy chain junction region [Mus musculus]
YCARGDGSFAY